MNRPRARPDGLPPNVYERFGTRVYSIGYKASDGRWKPGGASSFPKFQGSSMSTADDLKGTSNRPSIPTRFDVVTRLLPEGHYGQVPVYSLTDLHAYGRACAAAERETIVQLIERANVRGAGMFRDDLIDRIRARGTQ